MLAMPLTLRRIVRSAPPTSHHEVVATQPLRPEASDLCDQLADVVGRHLDLLALGSDLPSEHGPIPAGGAADRSPARPQPADPERHPRPLDRGEAKRDAIDAVVLSGELERLAPPQAVHGRPGLVHPPGPCPAIGLLA